MSEEEYTVVDSLRFLATKYVQRDWEYTRITDIQHIRYKSDLVGRNRLRVRIKSAVTDLFETKKKKHSLFGNLMAESSVREKILYRFYGFKFRLRLEDHKPDGVLNGGDVITYWEESGEYIQMVQPSVGEMLADFLDGDPSNPHAIKIRAELERISDGYSRRVRDGEVDGGKREPEKDS